MLVRILILLALLAAGYAAVQKALGPKRLRVPFIWRSVAGRHPDVERAVALRTAIARLLLEAPDASFDPVMREVDGVVATLVRLAQARDASGAGPTEVEAGAIDDLDALHRQIRDEAHAEADAQLDVLRDRLADRAGDLRQSLGARRELDG